MIARLTGRILEMEAGSVILEVSGVGYEIEISSTTYDNISMDQTITLHTQLVVREDAHLLFGFGTSKEKSLFQSLIKINGVGPKLAIGILSGLNENEFSLAISENNVRLLMCLPGVGKKTAERLVIEMRDKVSVEESAEGSQLKIVEQHIRTDLEAALVGLGYKPQEAGLAVTRIKVDTDDIETLLKAALKELGNR